MNGVCECFAVIGETIADVYEARRLHYASIVLLDLHNDTIYLFYVSCIYRMKPASYTNFITAESGLYIVGRRISLVGDKAGIGYKHYHAVQLAEG